MTRTGAVASGRASAAALGAAVLVVGAAAIGLVPGQGQTARAAGPAASSGATTSAPVTASETGSSTATTTATATAGPTATTVTSATPSPTGSVTSPATTSPAATSPAVTSPAATGPATTSPATTSPAATSQAATASPAPTATALPGSAGRIGVSHVLLATMPVAGSAPQYQALDAELTGVAPLTTVRVRFRVHNVSASAATLTPRLEYRPGATGPFSAVAEDPEPGEPFHLDREWLPSGAGTTLGPVEETIAADALRMPDTQPGETPAPGHHTMGANPDRPLTLPADGVTEEEFTLRITLDARSGTRYQLRMTDGGTWLGVPRFAPAPVPSATSAPATSAPATSAPATSTPASATSVPATSRPALGTIAADQQVLGVLGPAPASLVPLTPGQRGGTPVGEAGPPMAAASAGGGVRYALQMTALAAATLTSGTVTLGSHGLAMTGGDQCLACHGTHTAKGSGLLRIQGAQSTQCFTCHDGTGASSDVRQQYADPAVPGNDPVAGAYYSHDALATGTHTLASENEFGGVSNRHSECGDCHNAHRTSSAPGTQTTSGWTASGRIAGISGVAVVNGPAGTAPSYTFLDGQDAPVGYEYQLCLKCHSGFTVLRSAAGLPSSRAALDKGVEFNPANGSYHPVEAVGTNQTAPMAASLAGPSPYKLWNFTTGSTVRCTHCHAGGAAAAAGTATQDADLPVHASSNRAILLRPYRDQVLKPSGEGYAAKDFALCYTCHAEAPLTGSQTTATSFRYHALHVSGIAHEGAGGTDLDTAGAGQGNALCAECHYRLHGSSSSSGSQTLTGSRLVNFAPDVTASGGVVRWSQTSTGGSCTLVCHGERHDNVRY